jgi:light-regulated signal transduction histidine kinase (bacteriophytochrome)
MTAFDAPTPQSPAPSRRPSAPTRRSRRQPTWQALRQIEPKFDGSRRGKSSLTRGRITVRAFARDGVVEFQVADTGCGIASEDLPHVFDRFWHPRKGERHGAGLGLAIVKGIVEAHGGRVWVESAQNEGSTFFFTLPVAVRREAERKTA